MLYIEEGTMKRARVMGPSFQDWHPIQKPNDSKKIVQIEKKNFPLNFSTMNDLSNHI